MIGAPDPPIAVPGDNEPIEIPGEAPPNFSRALPRHHGPRPGINADALESLDCTWFVVFLLALEKGGSTHRARLQVCAFGIIRSLGFTLSDAKTVYIPDTRTRPAWVYHRDGRVALR